MCAVNCPYNARKIDNVIKPCFNSVSLNSREPGDILSSYITHISYSLETLDIWYPIVSPITLIGLPDARYLRASFTCMSTGMAWELRVGLHNQLSLYKISYELKIFNRKSKSIPEFSIIKIQLNMPIHSFLLLSFCHILPMVKYLSGQNWGVNFIQWISHWSG